MKTVHPHSRESLKELDAQRRRDEVYAVFQQSEKLIVREVLWSIFGHEEKDMNLVRPRITELKNAGYIEEIGKRRDPVTGKFCYELSKTSKVYTPKGGEVAPQPRITPPALITRKELNLF